MPESALWTLIISLAILALGLTYKIADLKLTSKRIKKELDDAMSKIASLNEGQNQQIADIEISYNNRIDELSKTISELQSQIPQQEFIRHNDLLWLSDDPIPFCLPCHEKDSKNRFHMYHTDRGNPPRFKCSHCGYHPKPSRHPNVPEEPPPPKQRQPKTMTLRGWVTGWKD